MAICGASLTGGQRRAVDHAGEGEVGVARIKGEAWVPDRTGVNRDRVPPSLQTRHRGVCAEGPAQPTCSPPAQPPRPVKGGACRSRAVGSPHLPRSRRRRRATYGPARLHEPAKRLLADWCPVCTPATPARDPMAPVSTLRCAIAARTRRRPVPSQPASRYNLARHNPPQDPPRVPYAHAHFQLKTPPAPTRRCHHQSPLPAAYSGCWALRAAGVAAPPRGRGCARRPGLWARAGQSAGVKRVQKGAARRAWKVPNSTLGGDAGSKLGRKAGAGGEHARGGFGGCRCSKSLYK